MKFNLKMSEAEFKIVLCLARKHSRAKTNPVETAITLNRMPPTLRCLSSAFDCQMPHSQLIFVAHAQPAFRPNRVYTERASEF